jgi:hypothetical protein
VARTTPVHLRQQGASPLRASLDVLRGTVQPLIGTEMDLSLR